VLIATLVTILVVWLRKRKSVAAFARSFSGTDEIAGNLGWTDAEFQERMASAGWRKGEEWCMYFAKMVWQSRYKKDAAAIGAYLNGSSQLSYEAARNDRTGLMGVSDRPRVGDIAIWQRVSSPAKGHAGIVVRVVGDRFTTVEGNTTDDKESSDGGTVATKQRSLSEYDKTSGLRLRGFIRKK